LAWKKLRSKTINTLRDVDALLVPTTVIPALPTAEIDADMETLAFRKGGSDEKN
jgi:hypothetical protein